MKKAKQVLSILLAVLMIVLSVPLAWALTEKKLAYETREVTSGNCGDHATWIFDEASSKLTISGSGEMWNSSGETGYSTDAKNGNWPREEFEKWQDLCGKVKTVIFEEGVTSVGDYAFQPVESTYQQIQEVVLSDSVINIGIGAFEGCFKMKKISFSNHLSMIKEAAFVYCLSLSELKLPESLKTIGESAFELCLGLGSISVPASVEYVSSHAFSNLPFLEKIEILGRNTTFEDARSIGACIGMFENLSRVELIELVQQFNTINELDNLAPYSVEFNSEKYIGTIYCYSGSTAEAYAQQTGMDYVLLDGDQPHTHTPTTYTQPSTCTIPGYTITTCSECNEQLDYQVIPLAPHQYGDWVTVKEPTTTETGLRERVCTVCNTAKETEDIPMVEVLTAEDEASGIEVFYSEDTYIDNQVQLRVEEDFTGSQYLTQSYTKFNAWNIKTYVNGEEAQPNAPVTVRIPMPAGYDPNHVAVFHVNSKTGQAEKISDVRVENAYIVFTATSFSVYIVVDESSVVQPEPEKDPNTCPWCGKVHKGFFQNIIAFFHRIFAKLFGAKY